MTELKRISCVEDDADIRAILELALVDIGGYQATLFADGHKALEGLAGADPQLILLDMMMPGMNGLEVLEALKNDGGQPDAPVVFMTAKAQPAEVQQYIAAGAVDVIVKPFDPMTLSVDIQKIWSRVIA
ncbi:response regulator [Euryhalocaulis caribicus]|uniref:response regulator n=1 Tax=Euryhalocaulis caribicus TaxID=1161401 RepID=UPI0003AA9F1C|nr:response regulator [Euryhalocaulis caribicus]